MQCGLMKYNITIQNYIFLMQHAKPEATSAVLDS